MKQNKRLVWIKWAAALLAIFLGITCFCGVCCTSLIIKSELYRKPLETVLSQNYEELQRYYSCKIYLREKKHKTPLVIDNMEYGILTADNGNIDDWEYLEKYIYSTFSETQPNQSSMIMRFNRDKGCYIFENVTLLSSLLRQTYIMYSSKDFSDAHHNYLIVSNVKQKIDTGSDDLFAKQTYLLTALYKYRYPIVVLTFLSGIGFLILLIILSYSIKCQYKDNVSVLSVWHKMPFILPVACAGMAGTASFCLMGDTMRDTWTGYLPGHIGVPLFTVYALACIVTVVLFLMNLFTRYYSDVLWKYTLTRYLVLGIKRGCRFFSQHTNFFLKGLGIYFILWFPPVYLFILIQMYRLQEGSKQLAEGNLLEKINTDKMLWEFKMHGEYLNQINDGMSIALEERLRSERFRTELITNVSHDIKTPLTSIINYVDLLQKENITDADRAEYLKVLERQSARLKKLIEDLMEASKASTKNLAVNIEPCDIGILLSQTVGEYEEKLLANDLELVVQPPENPVLIQTDSRHLWRILDNLMNNICKYAQSGTRVYINQDEDEKQIHLIFMNVSKSALNISGDELMERFIRGDSSRNTEGSGLGLSIAQSLAELLNGSLKLQIVGDLFKVILSLPK